MDAFLGLLLQARDGLGAHSSRLLHKMRCLPLTHLGGNDIYRLSLANIKHGGGGGGTIQTMPARGRRSWRTARSCRTKWPPPQYTSPLRAAGRAASRRLQEAGNMQQADGCCGPRRADHQQSARRSEKLGMLVPPRPQTCRRHRLRSTTTAEFMLQLLLNKFDATHCRWRRSLNQMLKRSPSPNHRVLRRCARRAREVQPR